MASLMSNSSFGKIPSGTTANRPASPAVGDQYYNGTIGALEVYTSAGWKSATTASGNTSGRPANPYIGQSYFNGELGRLELYTATGWNNIVQETPGVASASGHYYESDGSGTFVVSGTNFVDGAIAYAVGTNGVEYQAYTTTYNSLVQLTVVFTDLSVAYEPYDIKITNPSNLFGLLPDAFYINDKPVWGTASGSLGSYPLGSTSISLSATNDESETLTYALSSGSLPTGLSLNTSTGVISGTLTASPGVYSFSISVSDGTNTPVARSFSITVLAPVLSGGTLTSDSTYYYRTFIGNGSLVISNSPAILDIVTIGGGAGGARPYAGGGGSGGATLYTSKFVNTGTSSVTVGAGGSGGSGNGSYVGGSNGVSSQFASLVAGIGGGGGGHYDTTLPGGYASAGGSGGGGGGESTPSNRGESNQTASGSGYVSYGNIGGYGSGGASIYRGGGGGGLGAAGVAGGTSGSGGTGGAGTNAFSSWLTGISSAMTGVSGWSTATSGGYIGGGGGGGIYTAPNLPAGVGGVGGGGAGGLGSDNGIAGTTNTGSGGGGAGGIGNGPTGGGNGAAGGSGIVIVRYTKASVGG